VESLAKPEVTNELIKEDDNFLPVEEKTCVFCHKTISNGELTLCSNCQSPHHSECWRKNKGCGCNDCQCRISVTPADKSDKAEDDTEKEQWFFNDSDGALVLDSHVGAIEDPLAGGMVMGCGGIFFGLIFSSWLLANSAYLLGVSVFLFLVSDAYLRHRLIISSTGGVMTRKLLLSSSVLSDDRNYLFLDELVELHLHTEEIKNDDKDDRKDDEPSHGDKPEDDEPINASESAKAIATDDNDTAKSITSADRATKDNKPKKFYYTLYGINLDGQIKPMFMRKSRCRKQVLNLVNRIAAIADCTVRIFQKGEAPSPQEIADAIKHRRLEARIDDTQ
jgi:hypothetical protein